MNDELRFQLVLFGLVVLTAMLFTLSLTVGSAAIAFGDSMAGLFSDKADAFALIMREIRLPRALLGLMVGATLGLSGATLQGYLRNPLAEPGLIGVSASASLGAVIAIYSGLTALFPLALPLLALAAAACAVIIVQGLAGLRGSSLTIILAGVSVSSFAGAITSLVLNLSSNPFAALEIMFWMLGSLTDRSMMHVWLALPFMLVGWLFLVSLGRALDSLTLGNDTALTMGFDLRRIQFLAVFGTAASVGASTAVAGAIGFVGLVIPHVIRPLVGSQPLRLLPASALGGASMLITTDILVRVIAPDRDLKLGVLTAIVGAPFFLWRVYHARRKLV